MSDDRKKRRRTQRTHSSNSAELHRVSAKSERIKTNRVSDARKNTMSDSRKKVAKRSSSNNEMQKHRKKPQTGRNYEGRYYAEQEQQKRHSERARNSSANKKSGVIQDRPKRSSINRENKRPVRRVRKRAERNSSAVMVVAGIIIFFVVLVYLALYSLKTISVTAIKNDVVKLGTIETPYSASGVIIRDEKVFNSSAAGYVEYNYADNDKVKGKQIICSVKNMENMENMETELAQIDEELLDIQSYRDELAVHYEDFKKYNTTIAATIDGFSDEMSKGEVTQLFKLKDSLSDLWTKRNAVILNDNSGSAQELSGQRKAKEAQIASQISTVSNDKGGIISYYADGYEDALKVELVSGDKEIPQSQTNENAETVNLVKSMVEANKPVFKMVYNNEWYIAAYIDTEHIADWEKDDYVTIYITGKTHSAKAEKAEIAYIRKGDKQSYVVFKMNKNVIDYITDRFISIKVSKADEGYKIVNSAITEQTLIEIPKEYVLANDEESSKSNISPYINVVNEKTGSVSGVDVKIAADDEESDMCYIQIEYGKVAVGTVVQSPVDKNKTYKLENVVTVKGIFITNSGITNFRKIDMDESVTNDSHTILNIEKNPYIDVYDKYAVDASTVYDDEKTVKPQILGDK